MQQLALEKRVDRLEEALMELIYQSKKTEIKIEKLSDEMREFKNEMKIFKDEMREFKREINKKWGDLANKLGTLAEDIVAPGVPSAIKTDFNLEVVEVSVRRKKKLKHKIREYDVIAVAGTVVFVIDVKSTYRKQYLDDFQEAISEFFNFFPEYNNLKIVPVIASLNLSQEVINIATSKNWLALHLFGDYLKFVNKDKVNLTD